tara:strand:- start:337 stop:684 length:348 start_codon:yes stop_codon:yes gene_type:complete
MVRLHSVGGEHACLGGLVLGHEIVVVCVIDFIGLSGSPLIMLLRLSVLLLGSEQSVDSLGLLGLVGSLSIMLRLGKLQRVVEHESLLVESLVVCFFQIFLHFLFFDLLLAPVFLL